MRLRVGRRGQIPGQRLRRPQRGLSFVNYDYKALTDEAAFLVFPNLVGYVRDSTGLVVMNVGLLRDAPAIA